MPKPFCFSLCADDYAMTPGVSRGILEALDAGAVSATSVLTTSPWWPESASALNCHANRVDIGLHLNLTLGAPLGPMPLLAPGGRLPDIGSLMRYARQGGLPLPEIAAEIDRQAERFIAILGRPPDHLDGHQHVHALAPIRPLVFDMLDRRRWRPWLRDSADTPLRILGRGASLKKALGLAVLARGYAREAAQRDFSTNQGFAGFSSFDTTACYGRNFENYIKYPGTRHLVMCHPGQADEALRRIDPVVEVREQELAFLTSPRFAQLMERRHATVTRLDRAPRGA